MQKLKLYKDWAGPRGIMHAGEYDIPRAISLTHAKCARADQAGDIIEVTEGPAPASATFQPETKENPREQPPAGKTAGGRQPAKRGAGSPAS